MVTQKPVFPIHFPSHPLPFPFSVWVRPFKRFVELLRKFVASFRFRLAGHDKVPHIKLKIFHFSPLYLTQSLARPVPVFVIIEAAAKTNQKAQKFKLMTLNY